MDAGGVRRCHRDRQYHRSGFDRWGAITTIPLSERVLEGAVGASDLTGIQVHVDNCLGPVSVRVYTQFSMATHVADTTVTVYSDPTTI
ncbi:MspA family porin [Nocardia otitidiscaviarum]|uniref:MspA family porin n=1 Tax=Nocardia otitidiscaviarum TaxID=1823 RepID=UPI000A68DF42|nr:MspA family porin [Nocardia otitidiscaviarum]